MHFGVGQCSSDSWGARDRIYGRRTEQAKAKFDLRVAHQWAHESHPREHPRVCICLFSALQGLPTKASTKRPTKVSTEVPMKVSTQDLKWSGSTCLFCSFPKKQYCYTNWASKHYRRGTLLVFGDARHI